MLIFNCTKAASEFFSKNKTVNGKKKSISICDKPPHKTISESEVIFNTQFEANAVKPWQWLVHAIKVNRKTVLITMDYNARFTIALTDIKKGDHTEFLRLFELHLKTHAKELLSEVVQDKSGLIGLINGHFKQFNHCAFYTRGDRSVQAHINDVAWHFNGYSESLNAVPQDEELLNFDDLVNELLRQDKVIKDYFYPYQRFLHHCLIQINQSNKREADQLIDDLKSRVLAKYTPVSASLNEDDKEIPLVNRDNVISLDAFRKGRS